MNRAPARRTNPEAGYSLAEMLTVIAIIGIMSLVFVPNFIGYYQSSKVKAAMRSFTSDVRKMRALAIGRGVQTKLSYTTGATARTYTLYYGTSALQTSQNWTQLSGTMGTGSKQLESIINFPADSASTPQTFIDEDGDGTLDVIFYPDGRVKTPAGKSYGSVTIKTPLSKVTVQQYEIQISPVGRVTAK